MTLTRMTTIAAAGCAALALLAGCGSGSEEAASTEQTRTVTDSTGAEVEVPVDPQSVATLHYAATEVLMDLDLPPIGQSAFQPSGVPAAWADELDDIPVVAQEEPDIEKLADLQPDLILAPNIFEPDIVEQLEDIAPVFQFTLRGGDRAEWKQRVGEVADAVNETKKLDALDEEFTAEQKRIAEDYADVAQDTTVATLSSFTENTAYVWSSANMLGTIYDPLGLRWSADEDALVKENSKEGEPEAEISLELVDKAAGDADIVFVTSDLRGEYDELNTALTESPVFKELPAVRAGHVYPNGKATIAGYSDARYTLEMVEKALKEYAQK